MTLIPSSPYAAVIDPLLWSLGFELDDGRIQRTATGHYQGRPCRVLMSPQTRTRYSGDVRVRNYLGHRLHIEMSVQPRTRCGVFRRALLRPWSSALKRWFGARPVEPMPMMMSHLACWAFEPAWAAGWLASPETQGRVLRLFTEESQPQVHSLSFGPAGALALIVHHVDVGRIEPERIEAWLGEVHGLALTADAAKPPLRVLSPTRIELFIQRHPMAAAIALLAALAGGVILVTLLIIVPILALMIWLGR